MLLTATAPLEATTNAWWLRFVSVPRLSRTRSPLSQPARITAEVLCPGSAIARDTPATLLRTMTAALSRTWPASRSFIGISIEGTAAAEDGPQPPDPSIAIGLSQWRDQHAIRVPHRARASGQSRARRETRDAGAAQA